MIKCICILQQQKNMGKTKPLISTPQTSCSSILITRQEMTLPLTPRLMFRTWRCHPRLLFCSHPTCNPFLTLGGSTLTGRSESNLFSPPPPRALGPSPLLPDPQQPSNWAPSCHACPSIARPAPGPRGILSASVFGPASLLSPTHQCSLIPAKSKPQSVWAWKAPRGPAPATLLK